MARRMVEERTQSWWLIVLRQGEMAMRFDRITRDPNRMGGQPCIRDLRITVRRALQAMAQYPDRPELRREYPELDDEDLRQALEFATSQTVVGEKRCDVLTYSD
jgi:uncharacterized protein (DUF433 family)